MMFSRNVLPSRLLIVLCMSLLIGAVLYLQKDAPSGNLVGQVGSSANNSIVRVDEIGEVGGPSSIAIDQNGLRFISYYDNTNKDLKLAKCNNPDCSSKTLTIVDSVGDVGRYNSITLDGDGLPVISYHDETNKNLKVAICSNDICSNKTLTIVDDAEWVGAGTSITMSEDGFPVISYRDVISPGLKVAKCHNDTCTNKTLTMVDANGGWSSIAIDGRGLPVISYIHLQNLNNLKVIRCNNDTCTSKKSVLVDASSRFRGETSIAIAGNGYPVIAYHDDNADDMKLAICSNDSCSSKTLTLVDTVGHVGMYPSIAIGEDGMPVLSYWNYTNTALKVAKCNNPDCSSKTLTIVDTGGVGMGSSIAVPSDGLPVISYYDGTNKDLKVMRCATPSCGVISVSDSSSSATSIVTSSQASIASSQVSSAPSSSSLSASLSATISCTPCDNISCTGSNKCYASNDGGTMCLESGLVNALWKECGVVSVGTSSQTSSTTTLVASSQSSVSCPAAADEPSGGTQVFESNSLQASAGITIKAHAHNLFECPAGSTSVVVIGSSLLEQCNRFWAYEYSGDEQARTDANTSPIFNGKFFISGAELSLQQGRANAPGASDAQKDFYTWLDDHNNLVNFVSGKSYYIMSEIDLQFSCSTGLRPTSS